jgi:hypothetical protein
LTPPDEENIDLKKLVVEEGYLRAVVESLGLDGGRFVADEL